MVSVVLDNVVSEHGVTNVDMQGQIDLKRRTGICVPVVMNIGDVIVQNVRMEGGHGIVVGPKVMVIHDVVVIVGVNVTMEGVTTDVSNEVSDLVHKDIRLLLAVA